MNMESINLWILTLITAAPIAGALTCGLLPRGSRWLRPTALATALVTFGLSLHLPLRAASATWREGYGYLCDLAWIPSIGARYQMGVDGLSIALILATALLAFCCLLARKAAADDKSFYILTLSLEAATIGLFGALDLFLFFCFWEATIVPMALLIAIHGQADGALTRVRAAAQYFLYMIGGSMLLLAGILWLRAQGGSFDYLALRHLAANGWGQGLFLCLFFGFAIKTPLAPLHRWLPDAHAAAPTAASVLMLKLGLYGMLRFCIELAPRESARNSGWIMIWGVASLLYAALLALRQRHLKRLLAYSSASHAGLAVAALFAAASIGRVGAAFQIASLAIVTGALFLLAGEIGGDGYAIEPRALAARSPLLAALYLIAALAAIGLPLTSGFAGEFLMLGGLFQSSNAIGAAASLSVVLGAWYMLRSYKTLFFGPPLKNAVAVDFGGGARVGALALIAAILLLGLAPSLLLPSLPGASSVITLDGGRQ